MNRFLLFLTILLQLILTQNAYSMAAADVGQKYASLGNFTLENGQHINDCKIGYRTFGKLNTGRTNAILYPTGGGTTTYMMQLFGSGSEVDTSKFYLILVDALGNGVSSSPSNSSSQPNILFPQFTISDMVNTEYKMLTEVLHLNHLAAIIGGSMGGLQALQWAVSYPDFMEKIVAIEATPKPSAYDLLWMHTYIAVVKSDTAYHAGNYTANPVIPMSLHLTQLLLTSPAILNNMVPADSFYTWLSSLNKPNPFTVDCNNMIWQTNAVMLHDITKKYDGSLERTAGRIKAKMLIVANKQDHMINQALSIQFGEIAKAEVVVMDDNLGHLIFSQKKTIEATQKFLAQ